MMNDTSSYAWAAELVEALQGLWPVEKHLDLVMAVDEHEVWGLHDDVADGACQIRPARIVIYLRKRAEDTEYWRDVLIHEYAHAALGGLLDSMSAEVPTGADAYHNSAYVAKVEDAATRLAGLLDLAVRVGATARA